VTAVDHDDLGPDEPFVDERATPRRGLGRGWIVIAVLGVVLVVGVGFAIRLSNGAAPDRIAMLGKPMPDLTLQTLDGADVTTASLTGQPTIINFWNTWCVPCLEEAPALRDFANLHATDGTNLVAIVRDDDDTTAVREYVADKDVQWNVVLDPNQQAALGFGTRGQPETYAISPSGIVVAAQYGPVSVENLDVMLRTARAAG
jgi:cytochrome c biogenesis protein CcmG/thiol:disulfide interchange protein DsbE